MSKSKSKGKAKEKFHLMILTANKAAVVKHLPHLIQVGYSVEIVSDADTAYDLIRSQKAKPRAMLISWTLPNERVADVYAKFTNELNIPCIVFSDDPSRKANNELLKSRIPNVIFPPLSGFGMDRRIKQLIKVTESSARSQGKMYSLERATKVIPEALEVADQIAAEKSHLKESFNGCLKGVQNYLIEKPVNKSGYSKVLMIPLSWKNLLGYLIVGQSANYGDLELSQMRTEILENLAKEAGVEAVPGDFIEFELPYSDLLKWTKDHAEILSSEGDISNQLLMAFADLNELPGISKDVTEEYISANLDGWIQLNSRIPFDIFVHLAANQKFIRYLRKGAILSEDVMLRLNRVGTERCFLEPKESPVLLKHCIQIRLTEKKAS